MADTIADSMNRTMAAHGLLQPGQTALVAVSGGADSMALLHLLHRAGLAGAVAHFDHQTRGGASAEDAVFVRQAAEGLGLPCFIERRPIEKIAAERKESFEMVAREARYGFFRESAQANGFEAVATGHHKDDQAETVLMRILRGASPAGLAGIPVVREMDGVRIIRPLLGCSRAQLVAWLEAEGILWREDASNADSRYERNRIRNELLPQLIREYNPGVVDALCRLGELQRMDQALIEQSTSDAMRSMVDARGRILRKPFRTLAEALQYRGLLARIQEADGQGDYETVQRAVEAIRSGNAGAQIDLGNGVALYLASGHAVIAPLNTEGDSASVSVPIPGYASGFGKAFRASRLERLPKEPLSLYCHPGRQLFDACALGENFTIRHRRPGDRFQPMGMAGSRKLKDVFNDLGFTKPERDGQLLVESGGEIVWIPGHTICAGAAVTECTEAIVELTVESDEGV